MPNRHREARKKPVVRYTLKERLHLRRLKRKNGPSAVRRRERRHAVIETLDCGCKKTQFKMIPCELHGNGTPQ